MAFRMAQPWKDPKTGTLHLRQRVPMDIAGRVKGQSITLPVGDALATVKVGNVVQVSLRTKDVAKAKELHAATDAALRRYWEAQRNCPRKLTRKEATALAGTLYQDFARLEDDPGSPELWEGAERANLLARAGAGTLQVGREAQIRGAREDPSEPVQTFSLPAKGLWWTTRAVPCWSRLCRVPWRLQRPN